MTHLHWLLVVPAYLLGSVSFAWLVARAKGVDLRAHGSGNLGATNAARVLGARWFFVVFGGDFLKGFLPTLGVAWLPDAPAQLPLAVAGACILGHVFTCFHGFRGGKAVATSLGCATAIAPPVAGACFAFWLVAWILGWAVFDARKSAAVGPASILAAGFIPIAAIWIQESPWQGRELGATILFLCMALLILVRHRSNLLQWLRGGRQASGADAGELSKTGDCPPADPRVD